MKVRRGFTLLEVMVAIAILGLGLSVILSSQVGLFSSASHSQNLTIATGLARCRMSEIEQKLVKDGYPLASEEAEGPCCLDEEYPHFDCDWKIERVKLPDIPVSEKDEEGGLDSESLGPLGVVADMQKSGGASLGANPDMSSLTKAMGEVSGAGMQSMTASLFGLVYPDLKGMLEASIRKITVRVRWKEGRNDRNFSVQQYVTNPQQVASPPPSPDGGS